METESSKTSAKIVLSIIGGVFLIFMLYVYEIMVFTPKRLRSKLEKQGIVGPCPCFLLGNIPDINKIQLQVRSKTSNDNLDAVVSVSHDWPANLLSHFFQWKNQYGPNFVYAMGNMQILCITDVEMVKEASMFTSLSLGRPLYVSKDHGPLMGHGVISSNGSIWARQRKIIAPQLYLDKVKGMVDLMVESTTSMLKFWETKIESEGGVADIEVNEPLRSLSGDIISRACFGSSYSQGEQIFSKLKALQKLVSKRTVGIPGLRYVPTKNNIKIWILEKQISRMILKVVQQRIEAGNEKDLLQTILESAKYNDDSLTLDTTQEKFVVDNCKNIYFAGLETTAIISSWVLMLLASYPEWQNRVREEVQRICKDGIVDPDSLRSMKILTMVIQEALRLYPSGPFITRESLEDIQLGSILVPKGVHIRIPVPIMNQDTALWGLNAHQFIPERFEHGIIGACKVPQAYIPFGIGPRMCVGQHMAMTELKVILSLILTKFSFSLSPTYRHSPAIRLVIEPEYGVKLLVKRI